MNKKLGCFLLLLCPVCICNSQQVVTSGGHVTQADASIDWIIGGSLADLSGFDLNYLASDRLKQLMESGSWFHIFPNPVSDLLYIEIAPSDTSRMIIEVFNLQGKILIHKTPVMEPVIQLDMKDLAEGTYYIKLMQPSDNQILKVEKIIKIKN